MNDKEVTAFEKEREYLENLLNSRFNFYLVFASLFLVAVLDRDSHISERQRIALLFGGATVSLLISLSVVRTNILVNRVLKWLEKKEHAPHHPWNIISKKRIWIAPVRAGWFLAGASILITSLFFVLAIWHWRYGII